MGFQSVNTSLPRDNTNYIFLCIRNMNLSQNFDILNQQNRIPKSALVFSLFSYYLLII